jgi:hypothetical protein
MRMPENGGIRVLGGHDQLTAQGVIDQRSPLNKVVLRAVQDGAIASPFFKKSFIARVQACLVSLDLMHPVWRRTALLILVSLFAVSPVLATGERLSFNPPQFSTGNFHGWLSYNAKLSD